ncbi:uncharacterized protein LOC144548336 [Carex rostrata]
MIFQFPFSIFIHLLSAPPIVALTQPSVNKSSLLPSHFIRSAISETRHIDPLSASLDLDLPFSFFLRCRFYTDDASIPHELTIIKGDSLKAESVAPFDVEILDIHRNGIAQDVKLKATNDAVEHTGSLSVTVNIDTDYVNIHANYVNVDVDYVDLRVEMEEEIEEQLMDSIDRVNELLSSDAYHALRDDLKVLREEQVKWLFRSDSYCHPEDEGMSDYYGP